MNFIDPMKKIFSGFLSKKNCFKSKKGFFIKDLRIISNKNLKVTEVISNHVTEN